MSSLQACQQLLAGFNGKKFSPFFDPYIFSNKYNYYKNLNILGSIKNINENIQLFKTLIEVFLFFLKKNY